MSTLLVLTTGQTDVQLVEGDVRRELDKGSCAALHDEIERRAGDWLLVDSPALKDKPAEKLPSCSFRLCTPKLDAVMRYLQDQNLTLAAALILETRRDAQAAPGDPRFAGEIVAARLREREITDVSQVAFLSDRERLEDPEHPRDAIIRRVVVQRIDQAVRDRLTTIKPARVVLATTGGFPAVNRLIEEVVRLYAYPTRVDSLEVPDGAKANPPTSDKAVSRVWFPEPAASYQARRHALELIAKGNLLAAWGAVQHLDVQHLDVQHLDVQHLDVQHLDVQHLDVQHLDNDEVEHQWTQVVNWLADFAASLPIPDACDIDLLKHPRMAVRAALRVELALLAGDIPRAVHGTVAFFECAFWDWLKEHDFAAEGITKISDSEYQLPPHPSESQKKRFRRHDSTWRVDDFEKGINAWLPVLNRPSLEAFWNALTDDVRNLRHDVAHNEPTQQLMDDAGRRMADAQLWSTNGTFLTQPMVQNVLRDLGENNPARLCTELMEMIRARLLALQEQS